MKKCEFHIQDFVSFNVDDEQLLCKKCLQSLSRSKETISLDQAAESVFLNKSQILSQFTPLVSEIKQNINQIKVSIEEIKKQGEGVLNECENQFGRVLEQVKKAKQLVEETVKEQMGERVGYLVRKIQECQAHMEKIDAINQYFQQDYKNSTSFLLNVQMFKTIFQEITKQNLAVKQNILRQENNQLILNEVKLKMFILQKIEKGFKNNHVILTKKISNYEILSNNKKSSISNIFRSKSPIKRDRSQSFNQISPQKSNNINHKPEQNQNIMNQWKNLTYNSSKIKQIQDAKQKLDKMKNFDKQNSVKQIKTHLNKSIQKIDKKINSDLKIIDFQKDISYLNDIESNFVKFTNNLKSSLHLDQQDSLKNSKIQSSYNIKEQENLKNTGDFRKLGEQNKNDQKHQVLQNTYNQNNLSIHQSERQQLQSKNENQNEQNQFIRKSININSQNHNYINQNEESHQIKSNKNLEQFKEVQTKEQFEYNLQQDIYQKMKEAQQFLGQQKDQNGRKSQNFDTFGDNQNNDIYLIGNKNFFQIEILKYNKKKVEPICLGPNIQNYNCLILADKILIIGGTNQKQVLSSSIEFNFQQQKWFTSEFTLNTPRQSFIIMTFADYVAIIGGTDDSGNYYYNIEVYKNLVYQTTFQFNQERCDFSSVFYSGLILFIGGKSDQGCLNSVDSYQTQMDLGYKQFPDLNLPRAANQSMVFREWVYVFGGFDGNAFLDSIERYEEGKGWQMVGVLKKERAFFSLVMQYNQVIIFGFFIIIDRGNNFEVVKEIEIYDFQHNSAVYDVTNYHNYLAFQNN